MTNDKPSRKRRASKAVATPDEVPPVVRLLTYEVTSEPMTVGRPMPARGAGTAR
jgi:hypothetical protein